MSTQRVLRHTILIESLIWSVTCNMCGEVFKREEGPSKYRPGKIHLFTASGGWDDGNGFPGDLETVSFSLCSSCLMNLSSSFKIPADVSGYGGGYQPEILLHSETHEEWTLSNGWALLSGVSPSDGGTLPDFEEAIPQEDYPEFPQQGIWRHFKGGLYFYGGEHIFSWGEKTPMVVYESLEGPHHPRWLRPLSMWEEKVEGPSYSGPRFTLLDFPVRIEKR